MSVIALLPEKVKLWAKRASPDFVRNIRKAAYGVNLRRLPYYRKEDDSLHIGKAIIPHIKMLSDSGVLIREYYDIISPMTDMINPPACARKKPEYIRRPLYLQASKS